MDLAAGNKDEDHPSGRLAAFGHEGRDDLSDVHPINAKVVIQGKNGTLRVLLRHTHQASVGQGHREVRIPDEQFRDDLQIAVEAKSNGDYPSLKQVHNALTATGDVTKKKARLGDDGFAGELGRPNPAKLGLRPFMKVIAAV
jgi:hypothetical protein